MLYPLKFKTIFKDKIWGGNKMKTILNKDFSPLPNCGETWEISCVQGEISKVANGFLKGNDLQELIEVYLGDLVGESVYNKFGVEFPLLFKFIDASDVLSIQVHPDDKLARERHNAYGKTEMWYVVQADDDALIYTGFNKEINKETYLKHFNNKTLTDILNAERPRSGDVYFIPAGRVHAIGAGVLLAEIQQTSDVTYRIYDWDRKDDGGNSRELHTDLALDAIDYKFYKDYLTEYQTTINDKCEVAHCEYFTVEVVEFDKEIERDYNGIDSFVVYMCLEGSFTINYNEGSESMSKGETVLIPAIIKNLEIVPDKKSKMLEVYIK